MESYCYTSCSHYFLAFTGCVGHVAVGAVETVRKYQLQYNTLQCLPITDEIISKSDNFGSPVSPSLNVLAIQHRHIGEVRLKAFLFEVPPAEDRW
jgi:hypothetical protein